jgi:VWA domain-containing protein
MKLRDEFSEFIRDRWTKGITAILVPVTVLISIYSVTKSRPEILWVSIYAFVIIFVLLNALYIMLAREKAPVIPGKETVAKRVAKFSLLIPYARAGLVVSLLLIPLLGFVSPFSQPVNVVLNGTPTFTPTITLTPTQTLTPTETPTNTATSTLTPTATPKAQGVYYMIVLDASANMTKAFDGKTQWDAAHESINAILEGLEPGANYGLVTVGGSPSSADVDPCGEPSSLKSFFAPRQKVSDQIAQLQPAGGGSFSTAFALAQNQFEGLPENTVRILISITGSSDACESQDEWKDLEKLLGAKDEAGVKLYSEIIVLDENGAPTVQGILEGISSRSKNVHVQLPQNLTALGQAYPTIVNNINAYIKDTIANYPTLTPEVSPTATITPEPVTPTLTPTVTVTPSITATFGAPTTVLTWTPTITPVTPSATPVPATSVKLLAVAYLTQNVGCQIDVQVSVDGSPVAGTFHVRNDSYAPGASSAYPQTTLQVGTNWASSFGFSNLLTLSGDTPAYYLHEVWFEYNGVQTNHLTNLVCPGIPPP